MPRPRLIALLLALATLVIYLPVGHDDFLCYDDGVYVTANPMVQAGLTWAGFKWAFTSFAAANWHPVTWLSHMADCELFGLNAGAQHLVNALFHAANTALLFFLLWRLTGLAAPAALVAALFGWHPVHVESVAWVAERKDVLSTFFALLALLSYVNYARENRRRGYWLALLFFCLALLAKPMVVTLPFVMLLLDYWPLQRLSPKGFRWRLVWEKAPFFALTAGACVMTFVAQRAGHAVASLQALPLSYRLENAVVSLGRHLLKILWPADLSVIYPVAPISDATLALAAAALTIISVAAWLARKLDRCWLTGWLWFLGTLVPVIGLVQVGSASMADRYTYFPAIGIFLAVVFGLEKWCDRRQALRTFLIAGAGVALAGCVVVTEWQLKYWRDSETLFRHALSVTRNNDMARGNLAEALEQEGRFTEALAEYREAAAINPTYYHAHFGIGRMLAKLGRPAAALEEYRLCLSRDPQIPALHHAAACALAAEGNLAAALPEFAEAERLDPHYAAPHLEVAKIRLAQGRDAEARVELETAARAEPHDYAVLTQVAHYLAANADDAARDGPDALALALKANELSGNCQSEVFDVLGMAFAATGDFSNAVLCAQNALEFAPEAHMQDTGPIRERLEQYQNRQPWRESFRGTNAPPP